MNEIASKRDIKRVATSFPLKKHRTIIYFLYIVSGELRNSPEIFHQFSGCL
jgi:hypothetical protein